MMENKNSDDEISFSEDFELKSRWFEELRGKMTDSAVQKQREKALRQVERLRKSRIKMLDPGGSAPTKAAELVDPSRGLKIKQVSDPKPGDSENFVTNYFQLDAPDRYVGAFIKMKPKRGSADKFNLQTAKVFHYDRKMRQWNLVDQSGYNAKGGYIWAQAFRRGVYAAIALPDDKEVVRGMALKRFAFLVMRFGKTQGLVVRAADYFDEDAFDQLLAQAADATPDQEKRLEIVERSRNLYQESRMFKPEWPKQFPNNGMPEWHILEFIEDQQPQILEYYGIRDVLGFLPYLEFLVQRVGRWHPMGPWNVNGRVKSLVTHPTSSNILYAGAANGGVWKTTNGGDSWKHLWKFENTMSIGSIAISKSDPSILYAATGEYSPTTGGTYPGTGIYKSTNSGESWTQVAPVSEVGTNCTKIEVHPTNANIVYVATNTGVHKSINGGSDWDPVLTGGAASDLALDPNHPDTIYAGIWNKGIYKTTNGGGHWDRIEGKIVFHPLLFIFTGQMADFPVNNNAGWIKLALGKNGSAGSQFIVAKMGQDGEKMLVSADGGGSWYSLPSVEAVKYNEWCTLVAVNPDDHNWIYAGGVHLKYTDDGFNFKATTGTHDDHHTMVFDPNNAQVCWVACDGGVYKSTDRGVTWALKSRYLVGTQLMSLGVSDKGKFIAGSATQDQGIIQTEGSLDWDNFGGGNEWGMFVVDPNKSDNIYVSPGDGQLRRSKDLGRHFTTLTSTLTDFWSSQNRQTKAASWRHVAVRPGQSVVLTGVAFVKDEVKDENGNVTATYGPKERIYYSCDQGDSWSIAKNFSGESGSCVAYAPNDGNRVYAGTQEGHVYRSNNGGQSGWAKPYTAANRPPAGKIQSITVNALDKDTVYITYGDANPHVYRSENGGQTWVSVSGNSAATALPDIAVTSLVIDPENDDILYVGTEIGVFRSNNGGTSWYFYNDSIGEFDLPKVLVTGLAMHKSTRRLFASTMGRGLYYTYTSGLDRMQVLEISKHFRGVEQSGIQFLKVTDEVNIMIMSRWEVIRRIEAGTVFYTVGSDGSRAEVLSMRPDAQHPQDYVKTTPDATEADNLLSLPRFYHY